MGNHKEWRKIAKKVRRKRIRQKRAEERNRAQLEEEKKHLSSPTYLIWLAEQETLDRFNQQEQERISTALHKKWVEEETECQKRWKEQQERLKVEKAENAKQEIRIREEWEHEQQKLLEEAEKLKRQQEEREREQAEIFQEIEKYVEGEVDELPPCAKVCSETRPGETPCPFFSKIGACRFWDQCSRNHIRPGVSSILLFPGFYTHFGMDHAKDNEYDTDIALEYEESDTYQHFLDFYYDVLSELKTFGTVVQFKVCGNAEPHLRGNVYVQFSLERYAIRAYRAMQGRYYGGKQISLQFCNIPSWSNAICGLFFRRKCPKGKRCNFMHVFRNPHGEFFKADRDLHMKTSIENHRRESREEWRWSSSPEYTSVTDSMRSYSSSKSSRNHEDSSTRRKRKQKRSHSHRKKPRSQHDSSPNSSISSTTCESSYKNGRKHRQNRSRSSSYNSPHRSRLKTLSSNNTAKDKSPRHKSDDFSPSKHHKKQIHKKRNSSRDSADNKLKNSRKTDTIYEKSKSHTNRSSPVLLSNTKKNSNRNFRSKQRHMRTHRSSSPSSISDSQ